jgi:NADH dehydrogenase FAD-containing subunit
LVPFDKLFTNPNGTFVEGIVESIQAEKKGGSVVLQDGQKLPYDVLVLAPGSIWEGPLNIPTDSKEVAAFIAEDRANFKKAQKIVLVGGGAVGVGKYFIVVVSSAAYPFKKNSPERSRTCGRWVYLLLLLQ